AMAAALHGTQLLVKSAHCFCRPAPPRRPSADRTLLPFPPLHLTEHRRMARGHRGGIQSPNAPSRSKKYHSKKLSRQKNVTAKIHAGKHHLISNKYSRRCASRAATRGRARGSGSHTMCDDHTQSCRTN